MPCRHTEDVFQGSTATTISCLLQRRHMPFLSVSRHLQSVDLQVCACLPCRDADDVFYNCTVNTVLSKTPANKACRVCCNCTVSKFLAFQASVYVLCRDADNVFYDATAVKVSCCNIVQASNHLLVLQRCRSCALRQHSKYSVFIGNHLQSLDLQVISHATCRHAEDVFWDRTVTTITCLL